MTRQTLRRAVLIWLVALLLALAALVLTPLPASITGGVVIALALAGAFGLHLALLALDRGGADDVPPTADQPVSVLEAELKRKDRGTAPRDQRNA